MRPKRYFAGQRRILFVLKNVDYLFSHRLALARALVEQGCELHVAAPASPLEARLKQLGVHFHPIALEAHSTNPLAEAASFFSMLRLYRKLRPDLVHHYSIKPMLYGSLAARLTAVPSAVSSVTGLGYLFTGQSVPQRLLRSSVVALYKLAFRGSGRAVIFQNPDDRAFFLEKQLVSSAITHLVKGSGVDLAEFADAPEPPGVVTVLLASRMLTLKGIEDFVEAARRLKHEGVEARFLLVGETEHGNPASIPASRLESWAGEGVIEWLGWKQDMPRVLSDAHIVCLPSRYPEGIPRVLIEAASSARPIVTTDTPGCREIVHHDENGLLVPAQDVPALQSALERLILDRELRMKMGRAGRRLVEEEFCDEKIIDQTLRIYATLTEPSDA